MKIIQHIYFPLLFLMIITNPYKGFSQINKDKSIVNGVLVTRQFVSETLLMALSTPTGAPFAPIKTLAIENVNWANNIDDLVGRIVKVTKDPSGGEKIDLMLNIIYDTVKVKVTPPGHPEIDYKLISKEKAGEISFMGVGTNMSSNEKYEYNSITLAFSRVLDKQINKALIPKNLECSNPIDCEYFYINAASVQTCETLLLKEKKGNIKIKNLPMPAALVPVEGSYYSGNKNESRTRKNIVFCTMLSLPKIN